MNLKMEGAISSGHTLNGLQGNTGAFVAICFQSLQNPVKFCIFWKNCGFQPFCAFFWLSAKNILDFRKFNILEHMFFETKLSVMVFLFHFLSFDIFLNNSSHIPAKMF
eukprot:EG_transcript_32295